MRWRRRRDPDPLDSLQVGELVTVRAYAGARADEEPRALVVGGREIPVDGVEYRAVVEEGGRRARVFVVRAGRKRLRLALHDDAAAWEVQRIAEVPGAEGT